MGRVAQSVYRLATAWTVRGSNPGGGEIFRTCPDRPWGPPSLLYNGYRVFPEGKEGPGRDADPSPTSSAVVSTPPMGRTACTEPQYLYKGALYLTFTKTLIDRQFVYIYIYIYIYIFVYIIMYISMSHHHTSSK